MELREVFEVVRDVIQARRVFGEPVVQGETTVIPAATVVGAAGSGGGQGLPEAPPGARKASSSGAPPPGVGGGLGYAMVAWPSGAYEIRDGGARWVPALDVNRLVVIAFLLLALLLRRRRD